MARGEDVAPVLDGGVERSADAGARPDVLAPWLSLAILLTSAGCLPTRTRELLILRVALRCSCEYEWVDHVPSALGAGMTTAEIASLAQGTGSWSEAEAAALDVVDDLCTDDCASEQTWQRLSAAYDQGEIIEVLLLIGFYRMTAGFLNTLGVPAEPGRPRVGQGMAYEAPVPAGRPLSTGAAGTLAKTQPEGTWQLKLYHLAITQDLRLVLVSRVGELSGSLTNETAGGTVPISEAKIQGHQVTFITVTTKPLPITTTWEGMIEGDPFAGTATVSGMSSFPFDGTRVTQR